MNEEAMTRVGSQRQKEKKKIYGSKAVSLDSTL